MRLSAFAVAVLTLAACDQPMVEPNSEKADVFGEDSRQDLHTFPADHQYRQWARSTAAVFTGGTELAPSDEEALSFAPKVGSHPRLDQLILEAHNAEGELVPRMLCEGERFSRQPASGWVGSGFLVGPDLLVTAGHVVHAGEAGANSLQSACSNLSIVFGYGYEEEPAPDALFSALQVPASNIYTCSEVLVHSYRGLTAEFDYAVIRLDRDVEGREPLAFAREAELETGQTEIVIGHPLGLPTKVAMGTIEDLDSILIGAQVDTFSGNSGSPVFTEDGTVVGMHIKRASWTHFMVNPNDSSCAIPTNCTEFPDYCTQRNGLARHFPMHRIAAQIDALLENQPQE